jgi:hypothetical protein
LCTSVLIFFEILKRGVKYLIALMASDNRRNSFGLTWAEQWDYSFNDQEKEEKNKSVIVTRLADYNKKMKHAASVGAKKVKEGTSAGIRWAKHQYHKNTQK